MKYVITEKQHKLILEDRTSIFQELVDTALKSIKDSCDDLDADNFPTDISFATCDEIPSVEKIKILKHEFLGEKKNLALKLYVEVYFNNLTHQTFDYMQWDIAKRINDWVSVPVRIEIEREINTRKNFDW